MCIRDRGEGEQSVGINGGELEGDLPAVDFNAADAFGGTAHELLVAFQGGVGLGCHGVELRHPGRVFHRELHIVSGNRRAVVPVDVVPQYELDGQTIFAYPILLGQLALVGGEVLVGHHQAVEEELLGLSLIHI